jgi:AcrR family transcriptional regulator
MLSIPTRMVLSMPTTTTKPRLSRERWIEAALAALAENGVEAVAVEPLARRLGVTKGSFYWHFRDRDELLAATLAEWERERTEELIERLDSIEDPRERLAEWARHAFVADKALLVGLHAAAEHPLVAPVLRRVTERRIEWLADLFREAGVAPAAARRRARLLYSADLGLFQVGRALSDSETSERELRALIREIQDAYLPRES